VNDPRKRKWTVGNRYIPPRVFVVPGTHGVIAVVTPPIAGVITYQLHDLKQYAAIASLAALNQFRMQQSLMSLSFTYARFAV
jgi:hypothetical protein